MARENLRGLCAEAVSLLKALRNRLRAVTAEIDAWTYEAGDGNAFVTVAADGRLLELDLPRGLLLTGTLDADGSTVLGWADSDAALQHACLTLVDAINSARCNAQCAAAEALRREFPEAFPLRTAGSCGDGIDAVVKDLNREWDYAVRLMCVGRPERSRERHIVAIVEKYADLGTVTIDGNGVLHAIDLDADTVLDTREDTVIDAVTTAVNAAIAMVAPTATSVLIDETWSPALGIAE
ncbi:YbaB/EbfC family nucleoid-associated protein [Nocardia altamirensis]|uniref:YbaB/EbfC family nucleoid-associated protein n=1 Tax=Nocardia altamirensis TaxID=472158 RepID=UPI0008403487|nr:YbaB/EbfC family nucleoid-associated protein [Nocardia altamirensis]